jgi:hypothetical protein
MKNLKFIIFIILLAFALPYMYGGCVVIYSSGDFNNDKEQADDETAIGFSGTTLQAAIKPQNAESLAAGALAGGQSILAPRSLKLNQRSDSDRIDIFRALRLPQLLADSLRRIELDTELHISSLSNVITESNNLEGDCGGELSYTLTFDRTSGEFSGDLILTDYCDDGITVSGETDVDGTFDAGSGVFDTATLTFNDLSDESHTLDGEVSLDFTVTPIVATFTAYSKDRQSGQVYWLKDYSINLYELPGRVEIELFGTFYNPADGFVTMTTTEPFVVFVEDDWPASGQLIIQGEGATKARLTAIDQLRYRVEADTEGDGVFDLNSGILNWTEL